MTAPGELQEGLEPSQKLLWLWQNLASRLADRAAEDTSFGKKADLLRKEVIERFRATADDRARTWLQQTAAIVAWHEQKSSIAGGDVAGGTDWSKLRRDCDQMLGRIDDEQRAGRSRLIGLLQPPKEWQALLADAAGLLKNCRDVFQAQSQLAEVAAKRTVADLAAAIQEIDAFIDAAQAHWLPARLYRWHVPLAEVHADSASSLLTSAGDALKKHAEAWRRALREAFAEQTAEYGDVVVLLRALLEVLAEAPAAAWPSLGLLAHDLIPQEKLAIELIRDPKQPADWFSAIEEANVASPEVVRPGWALRSARKPWFCFPQARQRTPRVIRRTPMVEAAEQLDALARANGWLAPLTAHVQSFIDIAASGQCNGADAAAAAMLDALVQAIAESHQGTEAATSFRKLPKTHTHVLDLALGHLRRWCGNFGLEVLPRAWSFSQSLEHAALQADEQSCAFFFRPDESRGSVYRVRRFGLKQGDRVLRECALSVSAGPAPAGLQELDEVIKVAVDHGEELIVEKLRAWREAAFHGTLDLVVVQFYVDFWGELGEELRQQHAELAQDFSMRLFELLKLEFKLYPFYPVTYQDHPDGWLQRVSGRSMVTGRVRRVVRPGLQDEHGQLRVPALVEVE